MNQTRTITIKAICHDRVDATLATQWDEEGQFDNGFGRWVTGAIPQESREPLSFHSVVEAQNFADLIGATFVGINGAQS